MKDLEQVIVSLHDFMSNRFEALKLSISGNYMEHNEKKEFEKMYPIYIAVEELDDCFAVRNLLLSEEDPYDIQNQLADFKYESSFLEIILLGKATGIIINVINDKNRRQEIISKS